MERIRPLEISWKAYTVFQFAAIVFTTINIVKPMDFYVKQSFETYTDESWDVFITEQPKHATLYELYSRSVSASVFSTILLGLCITLTAFRKGEKWAWVALVAGLVAINGIQAPISYKILGTAGALHDITWLCVGLVILLIPAKGFLAQNTAIGTGD